MPATLDQAVAAIQAGDTPAAQALLTRLLKQDVRNEQAWLLLAQCVDSDDQRRTCLQRVLSLNPRNSLAQQLLTTLSGDEFQPQTFDMEMAASTGATSAFESALHRATAVESHAPAPDFSPEPFTLGGADPLATPPLPEWVHPLTQPSAREPSDPADALAPDFYVSPASHSAAPGPATPRQTAAPPAAPVALQPSPLAAPPAAPGLKLSPSLRARTGRPSRPFLLLLGIVFIAAGLIGLILPNLNLQSPILESLDRFTGVPYFLIAAGCVVAGILIVFGVREPKP